LEPIADSYEQLELRKIDSPLSWFTLCLKKMGLSNGLGINPCFTFSYRSGQTADRYRTPSQ